MGTVSIHSEGLRIEYPILQTTDRSLKRRFVHAATGGRVASDAQDHVVVTALRDVSFAIGAGERVALVGHNGSGKTTLLRAIAGVYEPAQGSMRVHGTISALFDITLGFDPDATGRESVVMSGLVAGLSRQEILERMDDIREFSGLGDYLDLPTRAYSSGMRMRLAFALATAVRRDIVLMDEWLSVGDSEFAAQAQRRLRDHLEASSILVVATHNEALVRDLCTRRIELNQGSVIADTPVEASRAGGGKLPAGVAEGTANAGTIVAVEFGAQGNDAAYLGAGWSGAEDGFRWAIGHHSELWLENPGGDGDCVLELEAWPYARPPALAGQRLSIRVREWRIGHAMLTAARTLRFRVPGPALHGTGPVRVTLEHPDALRPSDYGEPSDTRELAVCFRRARLFRVPPGGGGQAEPWGGILPSEVEATTGLPPAELMLRFESLGDNCEFGLVQRRCGAEPLGLLRFSNLGLPQLTAALEAGFDGLGEPGSIEIYLNDREPPGFAVRDRRFGLTSHTFLEQGGIAAGKVLSQQQVRLKFLRRKFLEDLAAGEKIFVLKRNEALTGGEMLALHERVRRHGPAMLLAVVPADAGHAAGTVEEFRPGLLVGRIDRFAPYDNAHDLSLEPWLGLCVRAFLMCRKSPAAAADA